MIRDIPCKKNGVFLLGVKKKKKGAFGTSWGVHPIRSTAGGFRDTFYWGPTVLNRKKIWREIFDDQLCEQKIFDAIVFIAVKNYESVS